jgi:polyisoprenoid-binding protein YceI
MKSLVTTILLALFAFTGTVEAQNQNFTLLDKSTMQIDGTSTIHDWTADVNDFSTSISMNSDSMETENPSNFVDSFSLTVPVDGIKSGKGGMDRKIYGALKQDDYPTIRFTLISVDASGQASESAVTMNATGELEVAGVAREITLPVESMIAEDGSIKFTGNYEMNMKDYNVDPPSAVFGTIKSGEKVTISFELFFAN